MVGRGTNGNVDLAHSVDSGDGWTVGSPAFGRGCARVAVALFMLCLGGACGVAWDVLHLPSLFGAELTGRAALCYLAWFCTVGSIGLGALCIGLQRADADTGGDSIGE